MAFLSDFKFTQGSDIASSDEGWLLPNYAIANSRAGLDEIKATTSDTTPGIEIGINARLSTSFGQDIISGISANGYGILNKGALRTGAGGDRIEGDGRFGIRNEGLIDTDSGDDLITAVTRGGFFDEAIYNKGTIRTGDGDDAIIGIGGDVNPSIINDGMIDTGRGADTVDGVAGGFWGSGKVLLGDGDDTLRGICTWGTMKFNGGRGIDRILLDKNRTYTIEAAQNGAVYIRDPIVAQPDGIYKNFELVGSLNNETCIPLTAGTLKFTSAGVPYYI